ncbi:MAG: type II toxin-antitoxin system VapC family toxin [Spirochaetaceae bacterium]|nr:MAG: type II toxin-antitoxin system VapC family toxin [Spirochaetaceae bacterium]
MRILLDTSVYSQPIRKAPLQSVITRWRECGEPSFVISAICDLEVRLGVLRSPSQRLKTAYDTILEGRFPILPFDGTCAIRYAELQAEAMTHGSTRPVFDLMIAVTALVNDLPLATCNRKDFDWVPELTVLDWSR